MATIIPSSIDLQVILSFPNAVSLPGCNFEGWSGMEACKPCFTKDHQPINRKVDGKASPGAGCTRSSELAYQPTALHISSPRHITHS